MKTYKVTVKDLKRMIKSKGNKSVKRSIFNSMAHDGTLTKAATRYWKKIR